MRSNNNRSTVAYRFFLFDTFLNWILGILFLFFYGTAEALMSDESLLPDIIWIIIGGSLLLFGFWQTYILVLKEFGKKAQLFSALMAWICFLVLTYALVLMDFNLFVVARAIIWIGNLYMFALGWIYLLSYRRLSVHSKTIAS